MQMAAESGFNLSQVHKLKSRFDEQLKSRSGDGAYPDGGDRTDL